MELRTFNLKFGMIFCCVGSTFSLSITFFPLSATVTLFDVFSRNISKIYCGKFKDFYKSFL